MIKLVNILNEIKFVDKKGAEKYLAEEEAKKFINKNYDVIDFDNSFNLTYHFLIEGIENCENLIKYLSENSRRSYFDLRVKVKGITFAFYLNKYKTELIFEVM